MYTGRFASSDTRLPLTVPDYITSEQKVQQMYSMLTYCKSQYLRSSTFIIRSIVFYFTYLTRKRKGVETLETLEQSLSF